MKDINELLAQSGLSERTYTTLGQGMAMGLTNAYMSLGRIIGPVWAGIVLDINLSYPFLTGAVIMLIAFVSSLFFLSAAPVAEIREA